MTLRAGLGAAALFTVAILSASPALAAGTTLPAIAHDIGVSLLVAGVLAVVFARFRIPSMAAFLIAGVLVGPLLLKLVTDTESVETISEIGFVLLLFMIGLEIDIRSLFTSGRATVVAGFLQYPLGLLAGFLFAKAIIAVGFGGTLLAAPLAPFYVGVVVAGSSSLLVVALFQRHYELDTQPGRLALGLLIFHDLWAIMITLVQPNLEDPKPDTIFFSFLGIAVLIAIAIILSQFVVGAAFRWIAKQPELIVLGAIAWCFAMVVIGSGIDNITELLGFNWHMAVGTGMAALIAGATIASLPFATEIVTKVGVMKDFFLTLFFVGLGISVPMIYGWGVPLLAVAIAVFAILIRQFILFPLFFWLGVDQRNAEVTAIRLAQISEFGLVISFLGVSEHHISEELGSVFIFAFIFTGVLTTPLYKRAYRIHAMLRPLLNRLGFREPEENKAEHKEHFSLALLGLHRDASSLLHDLAQRRPDILAKTVLVDFNIALHDAVRELGVHVAYGDISNEEVLHHAGVSHAKVLLCTISDDLLRGVSNRDLVRMLRRMNPSAVIIANAVGMKESAAIYEAGADYVYMARIEVARSLDEAVSHALRGTIRSFRDEQQRRSGDHGERREVLN